MLDENERKRVRRMLLNLLNNGAADIQRVVHDELKLLHRLKAAKQQEERKKPRRPLHKSPWAAIALMLLTVVHIPCFTDLDRDRQIESFAEEVYGVMVPQGKTIRACALRTLGCATWLKI